MTQNSKHTKIQLIAEGLIKNYRRRRVVDGVSLRVQTGEIVGLLGPNGAGKSTSFHMLTGLVPADAGTITLKNLNITSFPVYKRARLGLGYLPQEPSVFRQLTVKENLMAILELRESSRRRCIKAADKLIDDFHLRHVVDNIGSQLSGGERRRVEIARTLSSKPSHVLFDEPFAGVDPIAVAEIQTIISDLKNMGIGVLITDHSVRETLGICDRAYIINRGRILMQGTPQQVVDDPVARSAYLGESFSL